MNLSLQFWSDDTFAHFVFSVGLFHSLSLAAVFVNFSKQSSSWRIGLHAVCAGSKLCPLFRYVLCDSSGSFVYGLSL